MAAPIETKHEVLGRIRARAPEIRKLGVKRLELFGSFVRDEGAAASDVDFLVEFERGRKSYDSFLDLAFLLEEILGRPVELVTTEALSPHLGPRILREAEDVPLRTRVPQTHSG